MPFFTNTTTRIFVQYTFFLTFVRTSNLFKNLTQHACYVPIRAVRIFESRTLLRWSHHLTH